LYCWYRSALPGCPSLDEGQCIVIVRVEDGTLREILFVQDDLF
jgi:hypothetical protein